MKKPDGIDIFMIAFFIVSAVAFLTYKHYEAENKRLEEEYIKTLSKNDIINTQLKRLKEISSIGPLVILRLAAV